MGHCSEFFTGGRGMMGGGMFGMGIFWWGFLIIVILGVVYFTRNRSNQQTGVDNYPNQEPTKKEFPSSALDILDEEFAKGNISEEEYLSKKEVLKK
ncbi:SHOCT domain-containing protein [Enterococcus quebecensis]|uniref:SHOCT domain-containing protein n=1 Tax=Enterococcus quebecensis TaxID=903983 RepID=A0A1E5GXA6_9ENTE|nr:hypothetical protein [Enterococcus quebecensis]OEG17302.1 hypothetical protein BCR23_04675 [Enterococcus quebecensis]OJG72035.1 hypothetical protein RV12_GL001118 [Enterococcus quebecensis]